MSIKLARAKNLADVGQYVILDSIPDSLKERFTAAELAHIADAMRSQCHWPGCTEEVPPKDWGCERHWMLVPAEFKIKLIRLYKKGQEIDKKPSDAYVDVAVKLHHWCRQKNKQYNGNPLEAI